jgi:hypothetical protein
LLGSPSEDRLRVDQIRGRASLAGSLIRSFSATPMFRDSSESASLRWVAIAPVVDATWNSALPFSIGDGSMWAGRGLNARLLAGARASMGRFHAELVPQFVYSENRSFRLLPSEIPGRSDYAARHHGGPMSIDWPLRFGAQPFTLVDLGQSALWARLGSADVGLSTENQWWGPAIQNALIMSNNAPGIPHAFVRTSHAIRTGVGDFEAKAIVGGLTESLYFDDDATNDRRSLSGGVVAFTPAFEPNATVGLARVVYSPAPRSGSIAKHTLDALLRSSTTRPDSGRVGSDTFDQLFSMFGRWVFPASGLEIYGEWARMLPPSSLRRLLIDPQYTQGYTIGAQYAGSVRSNALLRFQVELSYLEQAPSSRAADTLSFYTSRAVPQGYTHRGQLIGAPIGPGGSGETIAVDYMPRGWDVGVFAQRIRWDDDAYWTQPSGFSFFSHDVTVLAGLRGTARVLGGELHAEWSASTRYNFLFQNLLGGYGPQSENDVRNTTLRFWFAPLASRR